MVVIKSVCRIFVKLQIVEIAPTVVIVVKLGKICVQLFSPGSLVQILSHRHERHRGVENIQCFYVRRCGQQGQPSRAATLE